MVGRFVLCLLIKGLVFNPTFPEVFAGFWSWSKISQNNFLFLLKKKKKEDRNASVKLIHKPGSNINTNCLLH